MRAIAQLRNNAFTSTARNEMHPFKIGQVWETRHQRLARVEAVSSDAVRVRDTITGNSYTTDLRGLREEGRVDHWDLIRLVTSADKPCSPVPASAAPQILEAAAGHMRDRAGTYDKPEGERSMAATVAAFNAQTGRDLTEADGWLLMVNLKIVRDRQRAPHRDSLEDLVAYSALMAEARLK